MDKRPVVFFDSGLGCLPYGHFFHSRNRGERLVCVADRQNFPYGEKSADALVEILDTLIQKIISRINPKIVALVCNTASVTALDFLREKYPSLPIVGTVPAVKPAVMFSKTRRVGVIGSVRTIKDPYIAELAAQYGPDCEIFKEAAPELIDFAQYRFWAASPAERLEAVSPYIEKFRALGIDSIVLACTHFLLLQDDFCLAAGKDIALFDSMEGVSRRVEAILDDEGKKPRSGLTPCGAVPALVLTGQAEQEVYWQELCRRFGFVLEGNL